MIGTADFCRTTRHVHSRNCKRLCSMESGQPLRLGGADKRCKNAGLLARWYLATSLPRPTGLRISGRGPTY